MLQGSQTADFLLNKPITTAAHAREDDFMTMTSTMHDTRPQGIQSMGLPSMTHKKDKMTYEVYLHFSPTATETMSDKMMRLIRNDISNSNDIR